MKYDGSTIKNLVNMMVASLNKRNRNNLFFLKKDANFAAVDRVIFLCFVFLPSA
jgi:hypothetical protein